MAIKATPPPRQKRNKAITADLLRQLADGAITHISGAGALVAKNRGSVTVTVPPANRSGTLVQQRNLLVDCVRELAPSDRELIRQYFSKRLTIKAVAEKIRRPINTVYKALNRIRKTLMDCVTRAQQPENQARRQP